MVGSWLCRLICCSLKVPDKALKVTSGHWRCWVSNESSRDDTVIKSEMSAPDEEDEGQLGLEALTLSLSARPGAGPGRLKDEVEARDANQSSKTGGSKGDGGGSDGGEGLLTSLRRRPRRGMKGIWGDQEEEEEEEEEETNRRTRRR